MIRQYFFEEERRTQPGKSGLTEIVSGGMGFPSDDDAFTTHASDGHANF